MRRKQRYFMGGTARKSGEFPPAKKDPRSDSKKRFLLCWTTRGKGKAGKKKTTLKAIVVLLPKRLDRRREEERLRGSQC